MSIKITPIIVDQRTIAAMKTGTHGVDKDGNLFYRAGKSALCLNDPGKSYSNGNADRIHDLVVTVLPPGTVIEIVVE